VHVQQAWCVGAAGGQVEQGARRQLS
jgi:hypothetical protein